MGRPRLNWADVTQNEFWNRMVQPTRPPAERIGLNLEIQAHVEMLKEFAAEAAGDRRQIQRALGY